MPVTLGSGWQQERLRGPRDHLARTPLSQQGRLGIAPASPTLQSHLGGFRWCPSRGGGCCCYLQREAPGCHGQAELTRAFPACQAYPSGRPGDLTICTTCCGPTGLISLNMAGIPHQAVPGDPSQKLQVALGFRGYKRNCPVSTCRPCLAREQHCQASSSGCDHVSGQPQLGAPQTEKEDICNMPH